MSHRQLGETQVAALVFLELESIAVPGVAKLGLLEKRAYGVVSSSLEGVHYGRLHELGVNLGAIPVLRDVALGRRKQALETLFQVLLENVSNQLDHPSRVLNYLNGLDA